MDPDEFEQAENIKSGYQSALDKLPEDVQGKILASKAKHASIARWLALDQCFEGITQGMVATWRHSHGWSRD